MAYSFGDTVIFHGIECVIVYDAGSNQSWGRYILCEKYDLNHYVPELGTGGVEEDHSGKEWGFGGETTGVTATGIGSGRTNTDDLIALTGSNSDYLWYYVNQHRTETGFVGWSVPSRDELNILYENKTTIGNFSVSTIPWYWSSSEYSSNYAWAHGFSTGAQFYNTKTNTNLRVRLIAYATDASLNTTEKTVEIDCGTAGASIYYTLDGSDPDESSNLYSGQITITQTTTIKAIGIKDGLIDSDIAETTITKLPDPTLSLSFDEEFLTATVKNTTDYSQFSGTVVRYKEGSEPSSTDAELTSAGADFTQPTTVYVKAFSDEPLILNSGSGSVQIQKASTPVITKVST